jgi:hypothetical protein
MTRRRWRYVLLTATVCLTVAATALAATAYRSGDYKGRTAQTNPDNGRKYRISFKIANGRISNVATKTRDNCPNKKHLVVNQNAFTSAKLGPKGGFTLRAGTKQQPAVLKGKVTGSNASGTLTDKTYNSATGMCKVSTTWTAKRVVKTKK